MKSLDRRAFLGGFGSFLSTGLLRPAGAVPAVEPQPPSISATELICRPQEIRSHRGVLRTTITAAPGPVDLGHEMTFPGSLYNGTYLPPVLRARMGDVLHIRFRNRLPDHASNLHFHGLGVSPRNNSDNVFIHVHPGDELEYEVRIPAHDRQGPGLFWYHPHVHGVVAEQISGGLSGGIVIEGFERYFPLVADFQETLLLIKYAEIAGQEIITVNGQVNPVIPIRPGEVQFWRIAHIGATLFTKLRIDNLPLYVLATDGHALSRPQRLDELFIGPGERVEALVVGPAAGEYSMHTVSFPNEAWKAPDPPQQIATLRASGSAAQSHLDEAGILLQRVKGRRWIDEIRSAAITRRRRLEYSRTPDRHAFMINGQIMDEARVDQVAQLGTTEEWTVINTDRQFHSFHIHQTAFVVTHVNGVMRHNDSLHDTFSIPPATDLGPGSLRVLIPFTDPVICGRFVYHCHAVDHEDKGMMGIIEVRG
jgi:suppressor of ftsI